MSFYNVTLEKRPQNGASYNEIMQYKMIALENTLKTLYNKVDRMRSDIDRLDILLDGRTLSRRERWQMQDKRELILSDLQRTNSKASAISMELKGMRKAIDVLNALTGSGNVLNDNNRRYIDDILSDPTGLF